MANSENCSTYNNCVSFVYSRLGLISDDEYVEPPSYHDIFKMFKEVDPADANILAVIRYTSRREPYVDHMAILTDDKEHVFHRKGVCGEVDTENIEDGLRRYLCDNDYVQTKVVFLTPKNK